MRTRYVAILILFSVFLTGCAVGFINLPADSPIGTYYSPVFFTGDVPLEQGINSRVSVVITQRMMRKVRPDELYAKATLVVHLSNPNTRAFQMKIDVLTIESDVFNVRQRAFTLKANRTYSTAEIPLKVRTYGLNIELLLDYEIDGVKKQHSFLLTRQTADELEGAMKF